jgi:hypothetical protein
MRAAAEWETGRLQIGNDELSAAQGLTEGVQAFFDATACDANGRIRSQHLMHDGLGDRFLREFLPSVGVPQAHEQPNRE